MKTTFLSIVIALALIGGAWLLTRNVNVEEITNVNNVTIVDGTQIIEITAKGGYQPRRSVAKAGIPTIIRFNTKGTFDCSSSIRIPSMNINKNLPQSGSVDIDIGVQEVSVLQGSCGMGMYPFEVDFQSESVVVVPETVLVVARKVLDALEKRDYESLEKLSSSAGLSWNELPSLDLSKSDIEKDEISNIPNNSKIYLFGYTDGKGDPINLTIKEYFDKWIYNHDYKNAPEVGMNKILDGGSNVSNTILTDVGKRGFVAFHFKGFDSKYEGMDWTTIYLIFDLENGQYKLRGIAKNNWTI